MTQHRTIYVIDRRIRYDLSYAVSTVNTAPKQAEAILKARMRLPADLKQHRLCLRCSKIHERRREQDEENLRKHAEPARREP